MDGSKIKANASKHKAMSYGRMTKAASELAAEVGGWLEAARAADAAEDARFGAERRGDEMPDWVKEKAKRLETIRRARAALEAEARAEAAAQGSDGGAPRRGRKPKTPPGTPKVTAQRNFTDPDSRIMKTKDGYIQGYNAHAAVDATHQVIVAHDVSNNASDQHQLVPLVDAVEANTGGKPKEFSADAGCCSEANLEALAERRINAYVATGRQKHGRAAAVGERQAGGARVEAMRRNLKRGGWRSRYRLRKQVVEPAPADRAILNQVDIPQMTFMFVEALHADTSCACAGPQNR